MELSLSVSVLSADNNTVKDSACNVQMPLIFSFSWEGGRAQRRRKRQRRKVLWNKGVIIGSGDGQKWRAGDKYRRENEGKETEIWDKIESWRSREREVCFMLQCFGFDFWQGSVEQAIKRCNTHTHRKTNTQLVNPQKQRGQDAGIVYREDWLFTTQMDTHTLYISLCHEQLNIFLHVTQVCVCPLKCGGQAFRKLSFII